MKYLIKINSVNSINEVPEYWTTADYIELLAKYDYPDAEKAPKDTLKELLLMAITDAEPNEAAAILLDYKLSDKLNEGQIQQISNDMLLDKISEEYSDISLHATLFHINQLLYKAFNGKFPNTKATLINCSISAEEKNTDTELTKEAVLVLLNTGLSDSNLIKRLFTDKISGKEPFPDAENIVWDLQSNDGINFKLLSSEYWISEEDFISHEFESVFEPEMNQH
ncbi:MAG: hypothetical protein JJU28_06565 [Cyclobacteriaceae bacterium]|nr:hypothetical protein [Cyclobacteriaceae bacterium]